MSPARGEVWLLERPNRKPRPVLVLLRDEASEKLNRILVVPSTTEARHGRRRREATGRAGRGARQEHREVLAELVRNAA